jgi:phosphonoacetaldehyde hydrolase
VPLDAARIRLVIFDWAGTTIDAGSRAPLEPFVRAFAACGVDIAPEEARSDGSVVEDEAEVVVASFNRGHGPSPNRKQGSSPWTSDAKAIQTQQPSQRWFANDERVYVDAA